MPTARNLHAAQLRRRPILVGHKAHINRRSSLICLRKRLVFGHLGAYAVRIALKYRLRRYEIFYAAAARRNRELNGHKGRGGEPRSRRLVL